MTRLHAGAYGVGAIVSADARGQEISENSVGFSASQFSDSASAIVLRAPAASPSGRMSSRPQVNLLTLIMCLWCASLSSGCSVMCVWGLLLNV